MPLSKMANLTAVKLVQTAIKAVKSVLNVNLFVAVHHKIDLLRA